MSHDEDLGRLRELPRLVLETGYLDIYRTYRGLPMDERTLRRELSRLAPELVPLVRLFALGDRVAGAALAPTLSAHTLAALERLHVITRDEAGLFHTNGMVLLPLLGKLAFIPAMRLSRAALFGDDTAALAGRLAPARNARCLVLHAGAGALALHLASLAERVIAVEEDPVALACAELNVVMNGLEERIELRAGPGADAVPAGERFDHVSANPPPLPFPPGLLDPAAPDQGGSPSERVLALVPKLLAETGVAQVIGADLGNAEGPRVRALLEAHTQEHGLGVALTVVSQVPLDASSRMLAALAESSARSGDLSADEARSRMLAHLEHAGCDRMFLLHVTASRGRRAALSVSRPDLFGGGYWSR